MVEDHANRQIDALNADTSNVAPYHPRPPLRLGDYLRYFYLLRVPLLMGAALALLPVVALTKGRELLGNLFVLHGWSIGWTTMAAMMLAWSVLVVTRVILLNGRDRFGVQQGLTRDVVSIRALLIVELLPMPVLFAVVFANGLGRTWDSGFKRLAVAALGLFVAHMLGYAALFLAVLVSPRYGTPAEERYPLPLPILRDWLQWAYSHEGPQWWKDFKHNVGLDDLGKKLPSAFREGYFDPRSGLLYPGQWLCIMLLALTLAVYVFIGELGRGHGVPAVGYLLLLLILLNWILGGLAFFLDRYRVPLLAVGVALVLGASLTPQSDHYYQVTTKTPTLDASPASILTAGPRLAPDQVHPHGRIVLVATAGGGIQAAAWTAQVLTGLQTELKQRYPDDKVSFADSIGLISSVSGGAVGTLFFANQYQQSPVHKGFVAPSSGLGSIVTTSEKPSLNGIGWALAFADFWRVFFPFAKHGQDRLIDRGWALEEGWRESGNIQDSLNEWRPGAEEGWRPALIFNSTIVETGEPVLLATTDIHPQPVKGTTAKAAPQTGSDPNWKTLRELFPGCGNCDVPVVTAVRLAASFPYVSPAARAITDGDQFHLVDGGYYDNYGVYSLLEWLREALAATPDDKKPDILIIQIRSFPSDALKQPKSRGWFYQMSAPLDALMSVRTTGQLLRDRDALQHFLDEKSPELKISPATFEFPGSGAPLSWAMNEQQEAQIPAKWNELVHGKNNGDWMEVRCFFHPDGEGCEEHKRAGKKGAW